MNRVNKFLIGIFLILMLLIISEVAFYFFSSGKELTSANTNMIQNQPNTLTTSTNTEVSTASFISSESASISPQMLKSILSGSSQLPKDLLTNYSVIVTLEGKILSINVKNKNNQNIKPGEPIFDMVLIGPNGGTHNLGLPKDSDIFKSTLKIIDVKTNNEISVENLKVGDKLIVKIAMDITRSKDGLTYTNWEVKRI